MGKTKIEWTDTVLPNGSTVQGYTFNPWWGCAKVSEGCKNCYAESLDHRYGGAHWGLNVYRKFQSEKYWKGPVNWNLTALRQGHRAKVFCASMADLFEFNPALDDTRQRVFDLIEITPHLDWLLLTKRPENILDMLPRHWQNMSELPSNVWLGCTAENQERFDQRIKSLEKIKEYYPQTITFMSMEPLLGDINMQTIYGSGTLDWVIVGGESGPKARPMNPRWAWKIIATCLEWNIPVFFKQWGEYKPVQGEGFYHPIKNRYGQIDHDRLGKHDSGHEFYGAYYRLYPKQK